MLSLTDVFGIGASDFEQLPPVQITNEGQVSLRATNDFITLEYNDRIQLQFTPSNPALIPALESLGEYIRSSSVVNITDSNSKHPAT